MYRMMEVEVGEVKEVKVKVEVEVEVEENDLQHHLAVRRMALKDSSPQLSPDAALMVQVVKEGVLKAWQKTAFQT